MDILIQWSSSEEGVEIEVPSNTKVIVKGYDKQKVGELAANIRVRPPEPYKKVKEFVTLMNLYVVKS